MVELFPVPRSLTGNGVRLTLQYFKSKVPSMTIMSVPTGTKAYDWEVPDEWSVKAASITDAKGNVLVDYRDNNLHLMGYSIPFEGVLSRDELEKHLYSIPKFPDRIPYVTSYYERRWGFCVSEESKQKLGSGPFKVSIDTSLKPGEMNYGEIKIKGSSEKEVLLSTYVCHPSMASNELSGPIVLAHLAMWLEAQKNLRYSYRILFLVETLGSIYYISKNKDQLKNNVIAGWVLTCLGDDAKFSYVPTRNSDTLTNYVSEKVLSKEDKNFKMYTWLDRGSDERQYNAPGIDLPIGSVMRSKYGEFPEYHTSADNLNFTSGNALEKSLSIYKKLILEIERTKIYRLKVLCEPHLSPRNMYPSLSTVDSTNEVKNLMNVISMIDGRTSDEELARKCDISLNEVNEILEKLTKNELVEEI
jgi:aminopeptidase-like protein